MANASIAARGSCCLPTHTRASGVWRTKRVHVRPSSEGRSGASARLQSHTQALSRTKHATHNEQRRTATSSIGAALA